ncbi:hypothetical protein BESB_047920 [Besnoitia besnoiti]|uniref:5'-Nucleotidase C-terminal domain-containing protein n=1 Tax=Besnoitia besnoiti TaxID=94643 RepID=A0A2A9MM46_BESBE|nr:hypothetical protein BESB_047920 [Besnoitia besnoiti]PFH36600.1 hypothetical protein BESB_047920 [Besnoitia besnoiti]
MLGSGHPIRPAVMQFILNELCPAGHDAPSAGSPSELLNQLQVPSLKLQQNQKSSPASACRSPEGGCATFETSDLGTAADRLPDESPATGQGTNTETFGCGSVCSLTKGPQEYGRQWDSRPTQGTGVFHALRMFGGDMSPGHVEYDALGGVLPGAVLRELQIDVAALGNHDIKSTWTHLDDFMRANEGLTTFVATNLRFEDGELTPGIKPSGDDERGAAISAPTPGMFPQEGLPSPVQVRDGLAGAMEDDEEARRTKDNASSSVRPRSQYIVEFALWVADPTGESRFFPQPDLETDKLRTRLRGLGSPAAAVCFLGAMTEELYSLASPPLGVRILGPNVAETVRATLSRCRAAYMKLRDQLQKAELSQGLQISQPQQVRTTRCNEHGHPRMPHKAKLRSYRQGHVTTAIPCKTTEAEAREENNKTGEILRATSGENRKHVNQPEGEHAFISRPDSFEGLGKSREYGCLLEVKTGCHPTVVLISHLGFRAEKELAKALEGELDLIFSGHSHTILPDDHFPTYVPLTAGARNPPSSPALDCSGVYGAATKYSSSGEGTSSGVHSSQGREKHVGCKDTGTFIVTSGSHGRRVTVVDLHFAPYHRDKKRGGLSQLSNPLFSYVDVDATLAAAVEYHKKSTNATSASVFTENRKFSAGLPTLPASQIQTKKPAVPQQHTQYAASGSADFAHPRRFPPKYSNAHCSPEYRCRRTAQDIQPARSMAPINGVLATDSNTEHACSSAPYSSPMQQVFVVCERVPSDCPHLYHLPLFGLAGAMQFSPRVHNVDKKVLTGKSTKVAEAVVLTSGVSSPASLALTLPERLDTTLCSLPLTTKVMCPVLASLHSSLTRSERTDEYVAFAGEQGIDGSFDSCRRSECPMGRLITDALRVVVRKALRVDVSTELPFAERERQRGRGTNLARAITGDFVPMPVKDNASGIGGRQMVWPRKRGGASRAWIATIALQSSGNIRSSFKGSQKITTKHIREVLPWDNKVDVVELTIEDLLTIWQHSLQRLMNSGQCILVTKEAAKFFPYLRLTSGDTLTEPQVASNLAPRRKHVDRSHFLLPSCRADAKEDALQSPSVIQMAGARIIVEYSGSESKQAAERLWAAAARVKLFVPVVPLTLVERSVKRNSSSQSPQNEDWSNEEFEEEDFWVVTETDAGSQIPRRGDAQMCGSSCKFPLHVSKAGYSKKGDVLRRSVANSVGVPVERIFIPKAKDTQERSAWSVDLLPIFVRRAGHGGSYMMNSTHLEQLTIVAENVVFIGVLDSFLSRGGDGLVVDDADHRFHLTRVEIVDEDMRPPVEQPLQGVSGQMPSDNAHSVLEATRQPAGQWLAGNSGDSGQPILSERGYSVKVLRRISEMTVTEALTEFLRMRLGKAVLPSSRQRAMVRIFPSAQLPHGRGRGS